MLNRPKPKNSSRGLLHYCRRRREFLKQRNDSGRPIEGTYPKIMVYAERVAKSRLPVEMKKSELCKWADLLAEHLALRVGEGNAKLGKKLRLGKQEMKQDILKWWKVLFKADYL